MTVRDKGKRTKGKREEKWEKWGGKREKEKGKRGKRNSKKGKGIIRKDASICRVSQERKNLHYKYYYYYYYYRKLSELCYLRMTGNGGCSK